MITCPSGDAHAGCYSGHSFGGSRRRKAEALGSAPRGATLGPYADRIIEAKQALGLEAILEVVLTITTDETKSTPAIGFDSNVIDFLHRVGASIDVDTYRSES